MKTGIVHQHDPQLVDVFVESMGLEKGNALQTPLVDDMKDENPGPLNPKQATCGQMLVPQPRHSRQHIRRE